MLPGHPRSGCGGDASPNNCATMKNGRSAKRKRLLRGRPGHPRSGWRLRLPEGATLSPIQMNRRTSAVYVASGFIVVIVLLSAIFSSKNPSRRHSTDRLRDKRSFIFKDVKYSGEKKGVVDWEVRAKLVRKFIDKPTVEMEGIEGEYRPKPDTVVSFKGLKGEMDTVKEIGTIQDVEVYYKGEYVIKSSSMDFDFQKSMASTTAPVDLQGKKFTMMGVGLNADTKEQVITVEKDVSGTIQEEKGRYKFSADRFTYLLKDSTYIFEGNVVVKGEKMDMLCDKISRLQRERRPGKGRCDGPGADPVQRDYCQK